MKIEKITVACELPVIRTVGRVYSTELVVGQLHTMIIRGVQREQIGYVESIDSDGTFVLKNMFGTHTFDVKNIKFLCV